MACLVNAFASFDTPEDPGGVSIVERKDFQAKRPLCSENSTTHITLLCSANIRFINALLYFRIPLHRMHKERSVSDVRSSMKTITGRWNKDKHLKDNPEEDLTVKTSQF